ncbi:MAG TPA: MFS transporter [Actinomycetota bacterium]|jgi:MFS family permease|nr:MFS transporter [Actinomycetota bacterium]
MSTEAPEPIASTRRSRVRRTVRRVAVDISPLRTSADFRRLWFGLAISEVGYQFTVVATFIQVFRLTRSPAAVGLTGLVGVTALAVGTLAAGAFVDAFDRRKILIGAQLGFMVASATLLIGALAGRPPVVLVYGAIALIAMLSAIDSPTRSAMTPRLVGRDLLPSALALNQVAWNATALLGPALAGVVIAAGGRFGLAWAYAIDLVTYLAILAAAVSIHPIPPERGETVATGWRAVVEGFAYLRRRPVLQSTFVIDVVAMVFGMPRALFPILAVTHFHRRAAVVGLLFAAPAVGALIGALTTGWVKHVRRQGMAVVWAVLLWGAGIAAFGLIGANLWLGLFFLALAGAADVISAVFRSTILQLSVPDSLRGRLSSIHILVVTGGPRLGDLEAGLVASAFSPTVSVVSGGLMCIVGAGLLAWLVPSFRRYRAGETA